MSMFWSSVGFAGDFLPMSSRVHEVHVSCWCPLARRMVALKGKVVGTRQADILLVVECEASNCPAHKNAGCLIGKELESRWR